VRVAVDERAEKIIGASGGSIHLDAPQHYRRVGFAVLREVVGAAAVPGRTPPKRQRNRHVTDRDRRSGGGQTNVEEKQSGQYRGGAQAGRQGSGAAPARKPPLFVIRQDQGLEVQRQAVGEEAERQREHAAEQFRRVGRDGLLEAHEAVLQRPGERQPREGRGNKAGHQRRGACPRRQSIDQASEQQGEQHRGQHGQRARNSKEKRPGSALRCTPQRRAPAAPGAPGLKLCGGLENQGDAGETLREFFAGNLVPSRSGIVHLHASLPDPLDDHKVDEIEVGNEWKPEPGQILGFGPDG
jgi:hypothetical protein